MDESNDEHQHRDLGQHRTGPAFQELVENAKAQRGVNRARQLANPAQHHHHERIHDVALAKVRPHVAHLAQGAARQTGNATAQRKGHGVYPRCIDPHARGNRAVLRDTAHKQAQACSGNDVGHPSQHGEGKNNQNQTVQRQRKVGQHLPAATHPYRVFYGHVLRTKESTHQLHQHQRDAPRGQQCLQRAAIQKPQHTALHDSPHQSRRHERHRNSSQQVPVKKLWQIAAKNALHHISGIGTNHHQLAMGHVDDAHQPIGNGQAQRHQQQDGPQTDAGKGHAQALAPGQLVIDLCQRTLERNLHLLVLLPGQLLTEQQACGRRCPLSQQGGGSHAFSGVAAAQQGGRAGHLQLSLDGLVAFFGQRLVQHGQALRCCALKHGLGSTQALAVVAHKQIQGSLRVANFTAYAVVGAGVVHPLWQRRGLPGDRIQCFTTTHDEGTACAVLHLTIAQGIQKICHTGGISRCNGVLHGGNAAVVVAICHGQGLLCRQGMNWCLAQRHGSHGGPQPWPESAQKEEKHKLSNQPATRLRKGGPLKKNWAAQSASLLAETAVARGFHLSRQPSQRGITSSLARPFSCHCLQ